MRLFVFLMIFLGCGEWMSAQSDTLVGVLKDVSQKAIKRYPVTLGSVNPVTVKTNGKGMFMFPGANLQDTLFVTIKKTKNQLLVPVNGYNYITITLENSTFNADRSNDPSEEIQRMIMAVLLFCDDRCGYSTFGLPRHERCAETYEWRDLRGWKHPYSGQCVVDQPN